MIVFTVQQAGSRHSGAGASTNAVRRTPQNSTPTSFRQWCEEVLKPAVAS